MVEESYGFAKTRVRLEEIVTQVRKKDTSLEKSLDLLEEGVRLANQCTELIDHADWEAAALGDADSAEPSDEVPADYVTELSDLPTEGPGTEPEVSDATASGAQ